MGDSDIGDALHEKPPYVYALNGPGRVQWVGAVHWVESKAEALDYLTRANASSVPCVEGKASEVPQTSADDVGKVRWVKDLPDTVELQVDSNAPGWVILRDTYFPGWLATVDGHAVEIRRADVLFRAVRVPAGKHRVRFAYQPSSVRLGGGISLAALLGLGLFGAVNRRRRLG